MAYKSVKALLRHEILAQSTLILLHTDHLFLSALNHTLLTVYTYVQEKGKFCNLHIYCISCCLLYLLDLKAFDYTRKSLFPTSKVCPS